VPRKVRSSAPYPPHRPPAFPDLLSPVTIAPAQLALITWPPSDIQTARLPRPHLVFSLACLPAVQGVGLRPLRARRSRCAPAHKTAQARPTRPGYPRSAQVGTVARDAP